MKRRNALALFAVVAILSDVVSAQGVYGMDNTGLETNYGFTNGVKMYVGGSLGYSSQSNNCNEKFFEGDCEDGDMSWKVVGGARFNPMFGAEVAYVDQGEATMDGQSGLQNVASTNHITGYQLSGVGYLPIAPQSVPNLELVGKAGVMFWERDTAETIDNVTEKSKDDGISPMIGLGLQHQFHQNMSVRGEWEHTFSTGADSDYETDNNNFSLGLIYSTL